MNRVVNNQQVILTYLNKLIYQIYLYTQLYKGYRPHKDYRPLNKKQQESRTVTKKKTKSIYKKNSVCLCRHTLFNEEPVIMQQVVSGQNQPQ